MQMAEADVPSRSRGRTERWRRIWEASVLGRSVARALEIQITDRMMALAAQAFLALMPLVIVVAVAAPDSVSTGLVDAMRTKVGLGNGSTTRNVQTLATSAAETGVTVLGFLLVLLSATSFSRALQRVYERSWRLSPGGLRSAWRPLAWIVGMIAYFVLLGFTFKVTHGGGPMTALRMTMAAGGSIALWWWTPFVLLSGRVRWRALLPTALATAVGTLALGAVSAKYVPHLLSTNERRYGTIGVAFAIESWLVVLFAVVLGATVLGAVMADTRGRLGVWARGSTDPEGWRRAPGRTRKHGGGKERAPEDAAGKSTTDNSAPDESTPEESAPDEAETWQAEADDGAAGNRTAGKGETGEAHG
ncbi:YhjD/YihY/BrkB family envelope integrity protein, partial [Yinghuangia sp. YIM S09857]|uniref:YhjD/YihY/BrkB family envelope integrity protein n=1 Tax=Yinghuangia sp. YIM S09857 TaxID=3436929 RepID=UPI003F53A3B5